MLIASLHRSQPRQFLPALISAGLDPTRPQRHFVWLGGSAHPPPLAQDLACGVLSEVGRLAAARRTNATGQIAVDLSPGTYSLRPVAEVREPIDVQILMAGDDEAAYEQLEAALADSTLSASARAAAAPRPAPAQPLDIR